jgi:hypothetical protein
MGPSAIIFREKQSTYFSGAPDSEDEGNTIFSNVGNLSPKDTASLPRIVVSSATNL